MYRSLLWVGGWVGRIIIIIIIIIVTNDREESEYVPPAC